MVVLLNWWILPISASARNPIGECPMKVKHSLFSFICSSSYCLGCAAPFREMLPDFISKSIIYNGVCRAGPQQIWFPCNNSLSAPASPRSSNNLEKDYVPVTKTKYKFWWFIKIKFSIFFSVWNITQSLYLENCGDKCPKGNDSACDGFFFLLSFSENSLLLTTLFQRD